MGRVRQVPEIPCRICGVPFWPWWDGKRARTSCEGCAPVLSRAEQARRKAARESERLAARRPRQTREERAAKDRERSKRYYRTNRASAIAKRSEYRRGKVKVSAEYRARQRTWVKRWKARHPDAARLLAWRHKTVRKARKRGAFVERVCRSVVLKRGGGACGICRLPINPSEAWHVDHIIPLSKGGAHSYVNTQPAHADCNVRKGDALPAHPPPCRSFPQRIQRNG